MGYVIKYHIKDYLKKDKIRVSAQAYEAIDKKVEELLDAAVVRAKKNKKSTLRPHDL